MQANLKCDRLEDRAFKNARSTIHSLHPFGDTNTWIIPVVSAKIWKRIVRPSSLYSLFIIYERKRHKDLLNILDAFKNVFFLFARHENTIFCSITMHWEHQFCSNYFLKVQNMICVSKFVSFLWYHFIIDSRKWKSNSFMLNNTTLYEEIKKILRTIILFFFAEIVSFISFLHLSYQKRNRHGQLWLWTLPAIYWQFDLRFADVRSLH